MAPEWIWFQLEERPFEILTILPTYSVFPSWHTCKALYTSSPRLESFPAKIWLIPFHVAPRTCLSLSQFSAVWMCNLKGIHSPKSTRWVFLEQPPYSANPMRNTIDHKSISKIFSLVSDKDKPNTCHSQNVTNNMGLGVGLGIFLENLF